MNQSEFLEPEHPPLPPNFFMKREYGEITGKLYWGCGRCNLYEDNPDERKVVACTAYCAWLDVMSVEGKKPKYFKNAEAWLVWGLK